GFLQLGRATRPPGVPWQIDGRPLDPAAAYRVASTDYLMSGREKAYDDEHLNDKFRKLTQLKQADVRLAVIRYLKANGPVTAENYPPGPDVDPKGFPDPPPVITHVR
ncbi:hypothetical protein ACYOEI_09020, partial [Singulisphaera rosea]